MPPDDFNEKIELLVNDENRIVTYKILSQELKIHVNKAKQCLMDFTNAQKSKGISLEVHYFLSGVAETDGVRTIKVIIVSEESLENAKRGFSELISSHIYSVYKGDTKDECALYSADFTYIKDKEEQNKYSAIKHPNIDIQPPVLNKIHINNDVKSTFAKKVSHIPDANSSVASKTEPKPTTVQNGTSPEESDNSKEQSKESKENKTSPEDKKQKSGTLMSMWQKKEEKSNGVKKESTKAETKGKEVSKSAPKNNIMSMFSKQAVKNSEKPPVLKTSISQEEKSPKTDVIQKEESSKKEKNGENKKGSLKRKAPNKNSKESSKSKKDSEFQPKAKKKHKRICTFDSSDSESEPEEEREKAQRNLFLPEEPMETVEAKTLTDDEEPIPPTPPVIHTKGRVRMWKTVQKTYEDEDGFLVTKTEKELVSASEDEEDPLKVNPAKKEEIVNKKNNSANKKQASLMSFFKQK